jgi:hypothetical protein
MSIKDILNKHEPTSPESEQFRAECKDLLIRLQKGEISLDEFVRLMAAKEADRGHIETYGYLEPPEMPQRLKDYKSMTKEQQKKVADTVMDDMDVKNYLYEKNRRLSQNLASLHWLNEHMDIYEQMQALEALQRCRNVLKTHQVRREKEEISWEEAERRYR